TLKFAHCPQSVVPVMAAMPARSKKCRSTGILPVSPGRGRKHDGRDARHRQDACATAIGNLASKGARSSVTVLAQMDGKHDTTIIDQATPARTDNVTFMGHPKGLFYLAFTEGWERFSYY